MAPPAWMMRRPCSCGLQGAVKRFGAWTGRDFSEEEPRGSQTMNTDDIIAT